MLTATTLVRDPSSPTSRPWCVILSILVLVYYLTSSLGVLSIVLTALADYSRKFFYIIFLTLNKCFVYIDICKYCIVCYSNGSCVGRIRSIIVFTFLLEPIRPSYHKLACQIMTDSNRSIN